LFFFPELVENLFEKIELAVVILCFSMFFTGLHTPGCQAALGKTKQKSDNKILL